MESSYHSGVSASQKYSHITGYAAEPVRDFIDAIRDDPREMISNLRTRVDELCCADWIFPLSVNQREHDNCYVCSPYTVLVPYARREVGSIPHVFARTTLRLLIPLLSVYFKSTKINTNVFVNNWMLATNLYPEDWDGSNLDEIVRMLVERYPSHAIGFRSLNTHNNARLIKVLKEAGFVLVPSKQVYIFDEALFPYTRRSNTNKDLALLAQSAYRRRRNHEIKDEELPRLAEFYISLYIDKYSKDNPQYTSAFIAHAIESPYFDVEVFDDESGQVVAMGVRYRMGRSLTLQMIGYDRSMPKSAGLYRLVFASALELAIKEKLSFNASSGVPEFKRLRGAVPCIEYTAMYTHHLPHYRQQVWSRLARFLERHVVPIMQKYEL